MAVLYSYITRTHFNHHYHSFRDKQDRVDIFWSTQPSFGVKTQTGLELATKSLTVKNIDMDQPDYMKSNGLWFRIEKWSFGRILVSGFTYTLSQVKQNDQIVDHRMRLGGRDSGLGSKYRILINQYEFGSTYGLKN